MLLKAIFFKIVLDRVEDVLMFINPKTTEVYEQVLRGDVLILFSKLLSIRL